MKMRLKLGFLVEMQFIQSQKKLFFGENYFFRNVKKKKIIEAVKMCRNFKRI